MQFCFSCEQGNEISSCRFLLLNNLYDIMGVCNVACHCVLAIRENKNSLSLKIGYSNAVYLYNRKYISPNLSHPIQYPNKPSKLQPHDFFLNLITFKIVPRYFIPSSECLFKKNHLLSKKSQFIPSTI